MRRDSILESLKGAAAVLKSRYGVESLALFGSIARGDDDELSDIDVAVRLSVAGPPPVRAICGISGYLTGLLGADVDVVARPARNPALEAAIEAAPSMPSERPARRLRDMLEAISRIRAYVTSAGGVDALVAASGVWRDGVERRLLVIAEAAAKLRGQIEALEPAIDWDGVRGMGNVLRHGYDEVEADLLRHVIGEDLDPLEAALRRLLARFDSQESD